jgi:glycosyltransferase involved in cell wall biosynthesis
MKILHVIPSIDTATGGPAVGLRQLCAIYKNGGHSVEVASFDSFECAKAANFPVPVHALGPGLGTYGYSRVAAPWFRQNISRFDVVFIDGIWQYNAVSAFQAITTTGVPFAVYTHGMLDPYFKRQFRLKHIKKLVYWHLILKEILLKAVAVLFTSEEEKILARQSFPDYHVSEIVVPYGTFAPQCDLTAASDEFLDKFPDLRGKRRAICLGRIHPKKGTDILIRAFAATLAKDPSWRLVIAGPDQVGWQQELQRLAEKLGVSDQIVWPGMLDGSMKWGAFAASEVFVLPSHQENFGMVVAESLACGTPVILSDKVNIWREIVEGGAGIIGQDTLEATTTSLSQWMKLSPEEIAAYRARSKECFDRFFNFKTISVRTLKIIEEVASKRGVTKRTVIPAASEADGTPGLQNRYSRVQ